MQKINTPKKPSIFHTFKVILWGFLGIRKNSDFLDDIQKTNPLHLILAGFVAIFAFVGLLILIIKFLVLPN